MTTSSTNNSVFRGFFEKQKLTGPNFIDWYRQLRIVLSIEDKLNYLEQPIPPVPVAPAGQQVASEILAAHNAWIKGSKEIVGLMLMTMEPEIQRNLEPLHAHEMLKEQEEGQSVSSYVLKMKGYIDNLERLGHPVKLGLGVSLILIGLRKEYDGFVQNYNMHSIGKTVNELHAMLKLHEQTLPKSNAPALNAIRAGMVQKGNKHKKSHSQTAAKGQIHGKGKNKQAYAPKPKIPLPPKRENPAKDSICHECGEIRHWKRNCPQYLAVLMKKKKNTASEASGSVCNNTGAIAIANDHGVTKSARHFRAKVHYLQETIEMGDVKIEKIDIDDNLADPFTKALAFPKQSELTRKIGLIPASSLSVIPRDGIFEIDFSNSLTNESSIYTVSNKRAKLDLDSALLWHCRLGHISKKRIKKLQHDGLLDSSDLTEFEKCVSCMPGKMARKPYTHQVERAKDLLGLIHTDVCGPFKIMSRQGASYYVTFTDDFSRYGYVYLLKHKHEVFETFKMFQKEAENQLGKTIKLLRSDRGGEYMSQKFLDHLKYHRIIAHRTPPYTPQHNGVSERRNKTLLDMVRSMMSQTTLSKSFWDYALETAARILNMVPTKKALVKRGTLTKLDKLEPRSIKCIFVGYPKETMGYCFYYPPENKVLVARNAEFLENSLIDQEASGSLEDLEIIQEEDDLEIDEPQSDIIPIRRSTRTRHAPDRMCLYIDVEEHELGDLGELANYKATLLDPESEKWLNAMNVEMQSMKDNEVWVLLELPPNGKTVGSYTQNPEIDYEETFSPVADIRAIRFLIAIAAYYDYEICVKTYLGKCFAMKDLGEAAYILGIKIYRDRSKRLIGLCQSAYIEKNLKPFCMENSKRGSIPMQEKLKLSKSQVASTPAEMKRMQNVPYASAVGSIMYVVRCTRPDVASAQNITSRFQQNPGDIHWTTVKNILKYLRNTKDMFLVYGCDLKRELRISCYTDAGYLTDADDLKSQTGYVFVLNGGAEAVWVRKFISELGVVPTIEEPISMYCDNTRAIAIANKSGITKDDNLADLFTKALAFPKHSGDTRNIRMLPASSLM
nr:hypothetical protein [Tanacetum cinerariifolium]